MKINDLAFLDGDLLIFTGCIPKQNGRVLRFEVIPDKKVRLICEDWWIANGGEGVEEVLETSDEKDAGG